MKNFIFLIVFLVVFIWVQPGIMAMGDTIPPESVLTEPDSQVLSLEPAHNQEIEIMYATQADLQKRLNRFYTTLYDDGEGAVDTDLVNFDLEAAATEIDGSVSARYSVPVTAAGAQALLKNWNLDLAAELAFFRSGGSEIPEKVKNAAEHTRKQLDKIVKGDFRLPADPAEKSSGSGNIALVDVVTPVMTRDNLSGF